MCGFAGFTGAIENDEVSRATIDRMLAALKHRGPEASGVSCRHGVMMGHCALGFVDSERAPQPFVSSRGTTIVFNGEIYNHDALHCDLRNAGVSLRTASDTEVLVELYERHRMRFVTRLRGMFSFALYDARRRTLVLARDPFGKKPLFYSCTSSGILFASELSALLQHPACPRDVDVRALADYLILNAFPAPGSAVKDVLKVRPGAYIEFRPTKACETVYWTPQIPRRKTRMSAEMAEHCFTEVFRTAVERRMLSTDSELGILLSGGLDSSTVAAVARQVCDEPIVTFAAGFEDSAFDEAAHAAAVASYLSTEHHAIRISRSDLVRVVQQDFPRLDEPLADPSLLPMLLICREARTRVRGVLTGDGADEALLGYRFFEAERTLGVLLRMLPECSVDLLTRLGDRAPVTSGNLPAASVLRQLSRGLDAPPEQRFYACTSPFGRHELPGLFDTTVWRELEDHDPFRELSRMFGNRAEMSRLERSQLGMICHFLRDVILTKVDRGSMLNSLEARSPFLDLDVFEVCAALPTRLKLRGLTGKYLLRRMAARWLPREVVQRRKLGFRAPIAELIAGQLRPLVLDMLSTAQIEKHGLFDPTVVRGLVDDHVARRAENARKVWALLCFQIWYDAVLSPAKQHGNA